MRACEWKGCTSERACTVVTLHLPHFPAPEPRALCPDHQAEAKRLGLLTPKRRAPTMTTPTKRTPSPSGLNTGERARLGDAVAAAQIPETLSPDGATPGLVARAIVGLEQLRDVRAALDAHGIPHELEGRTLTPVERLTLALTSREPIAKSTAQATAYQLSEADLLARADAVRAARETIRAALLVAP